MHPRKTDARFPDGRFLLVNYACWNLPIHECHRRVLLRLQEMTVSKLGNPKFALLRHVRLSLLGGVRAVP